MQDNAINVMSINAAEASRYGAIVWGGTECFREHAIAALREAAKAVGYDLTPIQPAPQSPVVAVFDGMAR